MKVLVACEYSGTVSSAFRAAGHYAMSCDILQTTNDAGRPFHWIGDTLELLDRFEWDLIIAHPPCTHLANIGAATWFEKQQDGRQDAAIDFFMALYNAPAKIGVAVENPAGILSSVFRKPDQYVQPWMFGDPWRKQTGLWLRGLPKLVPEITAPPDNVDYWVGGQRGRTSQKHLPSYGTTISSRSHNRSKFFPGIARAMAEQWGTLG